MTNIDYSSRQSPPGTTGKLDLVVYGATGYTGKLIAQYLLGRYGVNRGLSWGLAGRSMEKLLNVRDEIGASSDLPLIVASSDDRASLLDMARGSRTVISAVGPYSRYGAALVEACAVSGTDYLDLCGEPGWMRQMIDAYDEVAARSGSRILFSCGFDSIPFELGVYLLQRQAIRATGEPVRHVKARILSTKGALSGGTLASLKENLSASHAQKHAVVTNPFHLTPGFRGADQPDCAAPRFDADLNQWLAPFMMCPINTPNIHRSNFLLNHLYGSDFVYEEMMATGQGSDGEQAALGVSKLLQQLFDAPGPLPGEGPTQEELASGSYELLFFGNEKNGGVIEVVVASDHDPGYGSTARMISEAAMCLMNEDGRRPGGISTPVALLGERLGERLTANAGLTLSVRERAPRH